MTDKKIKNNTIIFTILTGICNVILTLAIMFILFITVLLLLYKVFRFQSPLAIQIAMPVIIIGGLVIDFFLSVKLIRLAIIKFNLTDKLNPKLTEQYLYDKKHPNPNDARLR